ncbi:hypothetical protein ABZS66_45630 [Dactylosporangium sp. NPDC005572]|uniref:hypothetical protein n=1 Tax=Dactylosporangium sp. NPDC005572 TaxID=3156889 RepID=UPI0033A83F8D
MLVLVEEFERRLGLTPVPGRTDERLIACFDAIAEQGHLSARLPRQGNRAVMAEWITAAGVTPTLRGFARTERLLHVHRTSTDCIYELALTMDSAVSDGGVSFSEKYDYLPRSGDAALLASSGASWIDMGQCGRPCCAVVDVSWRHATVFDIARTTAEACRAVSSGSVTSQRRMRLLRRHHVLLGRNCMLVRKIRHAI